MNEGDEGKRRIASDWQRIGLAMSSLSRQWVLNLTIDVKELALKFARIQILVSQKRVGGQEPTL